MPSALGIADGAEIVLRSEVGEWIGIARRAPMKERHLQAYWPETNVLISRRFDPVSGEPDYNAIRHARAAVGRGGERPRWANGRERRARAPQATNVPRDRADFDSEETPHALPRYDRSAAILVVTSR